MTKPTKWHMRRAKTQISLGIRPVWSESSLSAWRKLGSLATKWAHSEDSDQTVRMSLRWAHNHFVGFVMLRLIWWCARSHMSAIAFPDLISATPVAEWLRLLIFSALNRLSSHQCGFEPTSGHMWDKPNSACGWTGGCSRGSPVFAPPSDWCAQNEWYNLTGRWTKIKKNIFTVRNR